MPHPPEGVREVAEVFSPRNTLPSVRQHSYQDAKGFTYGCIFFLIVAWADTFATEY